MLSIYIYTVLNLKKLFAFVNPYTTQVIHNRTALGKCYVCEKAHENTS